MGQDRVGPSSKILASRSSSGLSRINGDGLTRAVGGKNSVADLINNNCTEVRKSEPVLYLLVKTQTVSLASLAIRVSVS